MAILTISELKYIEEKIKNTLNSIQSEYYNWQMNLNYDEWKEEYSGWTKSFIETSIKDLYIQILAYLEAKGMHQMLEYFKQKFKSKIDSKSSLLKSALPHPEGFEEPVIITDFKKFLEPFKFFDYQQKIEEESLKLISILDSTDYIVKNCAFEIKNEADIYKQVKWVLGLYYPSCRRRSIKASFIQQFKTYHPDILIPEIKTAIEYKLVNSKSDNLDDFIDQIYVDSKNYTGDYRFENFIAVIYLEDNSVSTKESIKVSWDAKYFPKNWKLVIVNGSPTNTKP